MEDKQVLISYEEAAKRFAEQLLKLYNVRIFPRLGKVFADQLFQTGIEAGAYLASLSAVEEKAVKIDIAQNAMIKFKRTAYLIDIMTMAQWYAQQEVAEIKAFIDNLIEAVQNVLVNAYESMRQQQQPAPEVSSKEHSKSTTVVHQVAAQPQPAPQAAPSVIIMPMGGNKQNNQPAPPPQPVQQPPVQPQVHVMPPIIQRVPTPVPTPPPAPAPAPAPAPKHKKKRHDDFDPDPDGFNTPVDGE